MRTCVFTDSVPVWGPGEGRPDRYMSWGSGQADQTRGPVGPWAFASGTPDLKSLPAALESDIPSLKISDLIDNRAPVFPASWGCCHVFRLERS